MTTGFRARCAGISDGALIFSRNHAPAVQACQARSRESPAPLFAAEAAARPLPAEAGGLHAPPVYRREAEPRVHSRPYAQTRARASCGAQMLILRVSGIRNRLSRNATAGTAMV